MPFVIGISVSAVTPLFGVCDEDVQPIKAIMQEQQKTTAITEFFLMSFTSNHPIILM